MAIWPAVRPAVLLAKARKAGHGCSCRTSRAWAGLEKYVAQPCGFFFPQAALLPRIDGGVVMAGGTNQAVPDFAHRVGRPRSPGNAGPGSGPV